MRTGRAGRSPSLSALVLQAGSRTAAVGVDHVVGTERVVIRPVPEILGAQPMVSGAFLDASGDPQLVLSPEGLIEATHSAAAEAPAPVAARRLPLLVIDDSLTTRMLEQGILETAGYEVDTASSGEQALGKARQRRYGAFIVDVEMPGMDGFTFIQTARAEPELAEVPSILVTSRDSAEDRSRGERAGAVAYIVKSAFDEGVLLKTIAGLMA
jgi:two-component system chemotaxis sensor kinase CheA